MSRKQRKRQGHYCWACGRYRANERFSGRGHARHVCRDCAKLGAEELRFRQSLRDIERCTTWGGIIPKKRRKSFERFLNAEDPRIRARAKELLEEDQLARSVARAAWEADEAAFEDYSADSIPGLSCCEEQDLAAFDEDMNSIPF